MTSCRNVVLLSGGMDSATLLYYIIANGDTALPLSVRYGQRHEREITYARALVRAARDKYGDAVAPLREIDLPLATVAPTSSQTNTDIPVPHGHYADESMKLTVVPNRNMILIAFAAAYAIAEKAVSVAYAAHAGDHTIYPDCRPEFADAMENALLLCDFMPITLRRPFIRFSKAEICGRGAMLGVPFHLTYSCYAGREKHCGKCGTDVERKEAFRLAKVPDPTEYEAA